MCGIIGSIGTKNAVPILLHGLQRLEYRGYDSAGLCVVNNNALAVIKKTGKVAELAQYAASAPIKGTMIGIAHTRWATHGEPNERNAHPHVDCKQQIAIVHNGIIENYHALKEELAKEGHTFVSETDSEILAHLIEKHYKGDLEEAVIAALKHVEGAFGLAVVCKAEQKIVAARRGSPLVLGIGQGEMFVASDISAIIDYTKRAIYLNDNEVASITPETYSIKTLEGNMIRERPVQEIDWSPDIIEKQGFKHFMLKEIFEQPQVLRQVLQESIAGNKVKLAMRLRAGSVKRAILVACGTSWHAAWVGKYLLEKIAGIPAEVEYASEFRYRDPLVGKNDLVIAISQSGETADTLAALREAKAKHAATLGLVNVTGSSIARDTDYVLYLRAGPEIGVASTKAFTSQLMALLLLSCYLRQEKGKKVEPALLKAMQQLPVALEQALEQNTALRALADRYKDAKNFLYLGRGLQFPVALEGALKLKEISYIHAEGYPAAEMKHGPIALVDSSLPSVFLAPRDNTYDKVLSNIQEIKARKGRVIAIVNAEDEKLSRLADDVVVVPNVREELAPMVTVIPLQLLAYHVADLKGLDVDKPRNLAKSVTVE